MDRKNPDIVAAILNFLKARPTFESIGLKPYRQLLEKGADALKPPDTVRFEPFTAHSIEAEWAIPQNADHSSAILFVHGGGYIAGSINSHREMGARIAQAAGIPLLLFNYRLAPEHPYPAGLNDVKTMYRWLSDQQSQAEQICILGDSAGGGLALALTAEILNLNLKQPSCLVLISPWVDLECKNPSHVQNRLKDPMLKQTLLMKTARLYTDQDLAQPLVSPINSRFDGICPVLIQVGENEVLLDDAVLLHKKLTGSGANASLEVWENMFHVWHYFSRYLKDGRQAIAAVGQFIRRHTGRNA